MGLSVKCIFSVLKYVLNKRHFIKTLKLLSFDKMSLSIFKTFCI
jgi:hypothetical protein